MSHQIGGFENYTSLSIIKRKEKESNKEKKKRKGIMKREFLLIFFYHPSEKERCISEVCIVEVDCIEAKPEGYKKIV